MSSGAITLLVVAILPGPARRPLRRDGRRPAAGVEGARRGDAPRGRQARRRARGGRARSGPGTWRCCSCCGSSARRSPRSLVTVLFYDLWGSSWQTVLTAAGVMTVVSYVLVGVGPRTLGRQHAYGVALATAGVVRLLGRVLGPVATLLILIGNMITPGRGFRDGPFSSEVELRELVDMAEERGVVESGERQHDPLGVRARRHDRPRGHGAAHRRRLDRAHQDRPPGAGARAAQRVQPPPGDRRERRRRRRASSTSRTSSAGRRTARTPRPARSRS